MSAWRMVRVKRRRCPEWLWWWAANPIPFWNDTVALSHPELRVFIRPLCRLLSVPTEPTP